MAGNSDRGAADETIDQADGGHGRPRTGPAEHSGHAGADVGSQAVATSGHCPPENRAGTVSRRSFLSSAVSGAAGLAVVGAGTGIAAYLRPTSVEAASTDGANVAWALGLTGASGGGSSLEIVGMDPSGKVVGKLPAGQGQFLRFQSDASLCCVQARKTGTVSTTSVDVYDALSGSLSASFQGHRIDLGAETGTDVIYGKVSPDGRYLLAVHQTVYVTRPRAQVVTKAGPNGTTKHFYVDESTQLLGLELLDLAKQRSMGHLTLPSSSEDRLGAQIQVSSDGTRVYVLSAGVLGQETVHSIGVGSASLSGRGSAKPSQKGNTGTTGPAMPARLLRDNRTLVRLPSSDFVQWFDLESGSVTTELNIRPNQIGPKAFASAAVFSPDETTVYVWNAARGTLQAVDIGSRSVRSAYTLPIVGGASPRVSSSAPGLRGAAISPDGRHLYLADGREGGGLWTIELPNFRILNRTLAGQYLRSLWITSSGETIFASSLDGGSVLAISGTGSLGGMVANQFGVSDFLSIDAPLGP